MLKLLRLYSFKYLRFIVCQLCLSKVVFKGWRKMESDAIHATLPTHSNDVNGWNHVIVET